MAIGQKIKVANGRAVATTADSVRAVLGVSDSTFRRWRADGCPGRTGAYDLQAIVEWARTAGPWSPRPAIDIPPDMQGEPTEALERYRLARAKLAERELKQLDRELVPASELHSVLSAAASRIKEANQRLGREYGPDAQRILNEACEAAGDLIDRILSDDDECVP